MQGGGAPDVEGWLEDIEELPSQGQWAAYPSPGEGYDCRLSTKRHTASALVWEKRIAVHAQVFPLQQGRRHEALLPA